MGDTDFICTWSLKGSPPWAMLGFVLRNIESGFPMGARAIVCDADMLQASSAVRADTADQPTAIRHMTFSASGSSPTQEELPSPSSPINTQCHSCAQSTSPLVSLLRGEE
jgi:hypothetical protein